MKFPHLDKSPFMMRYRKEQLRELDERLKEESADEQRPILGLIFIYLLFVLAAAVNQFINT